MPLVVLPTSPLRHGLGGEKLRVNVVGFEPGRPGGPNRIALERVIGRSHYKVIADKRAGISLGDRLPLGRNTFTVVGLTDNQVSSGGDPVVYITLLDSQELQYELSPPAARREIARGTGAGNTQAINAVIARVAPNSSAEGVVEAARRWKHLPAMTQHGREMILTRSVIEKARKQIGLFTAILLVVSAVIIALIIYTMTLEKRREIATLKLIGAPYDYRPHRAAGACHGDHRFWIRRTFDPDDQRSFSPPRRSPAAGWLVLAAAVLLVCILASNLGVRFALKIDPATALGG